MKKILILTLLTSCNPMTWINDKCGFKDDNIVEETIEMGANWMTGIDVDFTPNSVEQ